MSGNGERHDVCHALPNPSALKASGLSVHVLYHDHGEGALAESLQQLVLSDDGGPAVRQVIQHIVIDAGSAHTQHCRNHQRQRYDQDWDAVPDNRL